MSDSLPYYVTVLLREGYGEPFASAQDALEYAEGEMHRLLSDDAALPELFDGIFCQRSDTNETWRFEYVDGLPTWVVDSDASNDVVEFPATDIFGQLE